MATADHLTQTGTVQRDSSRRTWSVTTIVVLLVLAVVFGALWLIERGGATGLEDDLAASEQSVGTLEADLATTKAELSAAHAEITALEEAVPVPHALQAEVQDLYNRFLAAIQDPDAEEIAALFTPGAVHIGADDSRTVGADAIGEGWEDYASLIVDDPSEVLVLGDSTQPTVAVMSGRANNVDGVLITKVRFIDGEPLFSYMHWLG